jgi:PIN like domain
LREIEEQLDRLTGEYRQLLTAVTDHVSSWEWNDPVSLLYGKLFRAEVVRDIARLLDDIRQEHLRRFLNKIPPGYKDEAKDDQGIGDLLIWLTILELGSTRRTSVIFVSGEEKADWWHRSEHQQLYPRFELVDEFRRASEGHSFHIIRFSRLLELFGASTQVVDEVRQEERVSAPEPLSAARRAEDSRYVEAQQRVGAWLIETGYGVSPAHGASGFDYLVEGPEGTFGVDVMYLRNPALIYRRVALLRQLVPLDLPVAVVVVAEKRGVLAIAERFWARADPPFRLCTALLRADGSLEVVRPL